MLTKEKPSYKYHTKRILDKMKGINKWQYDFMIDLLGLFLSIKGRLNFLQLGRYGNRGEQHYRNQFNKTFDFLNFNKEFLCPPKSKDYITFSYDFKDYKDSITFIKPFDSKVYRIKGTTIFPKYYFDFGDKQLTYKHVNFFEDIKYGNWRNNYNYLRGSFYENELYIIFEIVISNKTINHGIYNKKDGIVKFSNSGFENDVIKGAFIQYLNSNDESILGVLEAKHVHYIKGEGVKEKLGLTEVNENDNPIIAISYFK